MTATVNRCLKYYWNHHVLPDVIDKERVKYCIDALSPYFGRRHAEALTSKHVREYREKRLRQGISAGTIYREVACLIAAIRFCHHESVIDTCPALRRPPRPQPRERVITEQEEDKILSCAGSRARMFIIIALETGGRPEAIDDLKWEQVDLVNKVIRFNAEGRQQTNKRRPTIPISEKLLEVFHGEPRKTEYVLGTNASTWKAVSGALKRAEVTGVTRKTFRHTWATRAARHGVDMWKVAGVLGTSTATAEKNYAHHNPNYLRDAVNF